jgi:hypothetical protein
LFGKCLFLEIVILIRITNPFHTGIAIHLKNERDSYSKGNGQSFSKKPFFLKKKNFSPTKKKTYGWLTTPIGVEGLALAIGGGQGQPH